MQRGQGTQLEEVGSNMVKFRRKVSMSRRQLDAESKAQGRWLRRSCECPWAHCPTYRSKTSQ